MRRISSRWTWFYKRLFPLLWFGMLAVAVKSIVLTHADRNGPPLVALFGPIAMGLFGYWVMRMLIFDLADEVWDDGNELIVKRAGMDYRIALDTVINVSYSQFSNPQRITLRLRAAGPLGRDVAFMPRMRWNLSFLRRSEVAEQLIERADSARRRAGA